MCIVAISNRNCDIVLLLLTIWLGVVLNLSFFQFFLVLYFKSQNFYFKGQKSVCCFAFVLFLLVQQLSSFNMYLLVLVSLPTYIYRILSNDSPEIIMCSEEQFWSTDLLLVAVILSWSFIVLFFNSVQDLEKLHKNRITMPFLKAI